MIHYNALVHVRVHARPPYNVPSSGYINFTAEDIFIIIIIFFKI